MKAYVLYPLAALLTFPALAEVDVGKEAIRLVPGGKVEVQENDEVRVRTPKGTTVEVEFKRDGSLDEASGTQAQKDVFVPGNGLLSLQDAVAALKKEGKTVDGEWSLDKDVLREWEYEFEGVEEGKAFEYALNAKTGKLVESKPD